MLTKGVHSSLGSTGWVARPFVDEEVAVRVVFPVELLHVIITMRGLLRLTGRAVVRCTFVNGTVIGLRRVPGMQFSVRGC